MAVYGSSSTFTNQILLLGKRSFHVLIIRSWTERLDHLVKGRGGFISSHNFLAEEVDWRMKLIDVFCCLMNLVAW
jgi:hypothetical protein